MKAQALITAIAIVNLTSCGEEETQENKSTKLTRPPKTAERIERMPDTAGDVMAENGATTPPIDQDSVQSEDEMMEMMEMMKQAEFAPVGNIDGEVIAASEEDLIEDVDEDLGEDAEAVSPLDMLPFQLPEANE